MKLYSENDNYKLYSGSMLDMLEVIDKESIDSIITDPPYELNFMNKGWDNAGISFQPDTWRKCYEVLKPGGYLLAFGGSRTFHRIAVAIEDAGFEIRDTIMWLYGSGFPKSMNIGLAIDKKNGIDNRTGNIVQGMASNNTESLNNHKYETQNFKKEYEERKAQNEWKGWGTALKPSFEPIIVARKPFKNSLVDNVIENGVGGINIDECRVYTNEKMNYSSSKVKGVTIFGTGTTEQNQNGRFPANTILTYDETDFDEVCGGFPQSKGSCTIDYSNVKKKNIYGGNSFQNSKTKYSGFFVGYNDNGSASRYFYCAKASKKDRDEGLEEFEEKLYAHSNGSQNAIAKGEEYHKDGIGLNQTKLRKNTHPTVKPTELMQYLVRLVSPEGSTILDCFNGSGSTGKAVMYENKERNKSYKYIGIELTEEYLPIAKARIEYVCNLEEEKDNQTNIFDFIGE